MLTLNFPASILGSLFVRVLIPFTQITAAVVNTRGNDSGPLKKAIIGYLNPDLSPVSPPLVGPDLLDKCLRGFNHATIGMLLMPIEYTASTE